MRFLTVLILLLGPFSWAFTQSYKVSGKVTDKNGKPLEFLTVASKTALYPIVTTDSLGLYELIFGEKGVVEIEFRGDDTTLYRSVSIESEKQVLSTVKMPYQLEDVVKVRHEVEDPFEIIKMEPIDFTNIPRGSVEQYIVLTTGARSNNELTSNYNVRGGSYDENLVYVNGFNVYRPFLTRSGQQEGMSFIHSALVKDIQFSAGGFNAEYGDKLSSVLDITYKNPDEFHGSVVASLLGVQGHVEDKVGSRFNYLLGARYRSNGYLLNSLPTKGAYNPVYWDAQLLMNYKLKENLTWSVLGHFSSNNYRFSPQTAETDFGTAQEAYSFVVYFEGQEQTRFLTMMGGTSLKWEVNKKTNLDFYATAFNTREREYFDILGQYYINELESDPSKEAFGDSIAVLGVGSYLSHARNKLIGSIYNVYHRGDHELTRKYNNDSLVFNRSVLKWGVNFQVDDIVDELSEWKMIDSAGYSIPQQPVDQITLFYTIKSKLSLQAYRTTSFAQYNSSWSVKKKNYPVSIKKKHKDKNGKKYYTEYNDTLDQSEAVWTLSLGARGGYTSSNGEVYGTPRAAVSYTPRWYLVKDSTLYRRKALIRFATGLYYQPPFYREFRTFDGQLNLNVKSQKSFHAILGSDFFFNMWGRENPFKLTSDIYYKYMWDVNPYEVDNVRTRYYAENMARAYAYGLDVRLNGEFVEGIQSFFKMSLMSTKEDIIGDSYTVYYNKAGEKIIFGYSEDQKIDDSVVVHPGYIPRPTDQWVNFGALIQDQMPGIESFTVQMGLQYGSRLPYGPPDYQKYKDTLRFKAYFRVDIGMSYDFLYKYKNGDKSIQPNFWNKHFTDAIISFEVFNLLGINNVLSKQWIQDVSGKYYAIPNYLTQRRFNLKLILRF